MAAFQVFGRGRIWVFANIVSAYIEFLVQMAEAEARATEAFSDSGDVAPRAFASLKGRLAVEHEALANLLALRASRDSAVRDAAGFVSQAILLLATWDSTAQVDYRRVIRFEMSLAELEEKRADQQLRSDQTLRLLIAAGGAALDGTIEMNDAKAVSRRMTEADRDTLVAELDRYFGAQMQVDSTGHWSSGWGALASTMRKGLKQPGWKYLPATVRP